MALGRGWLVVSICLGMVAFGSSPSVADPRQYVNTSGDALVVCDSLGFGFSNGGVCFEPGHVLPDGNGEAILTIFDDFNNVVSGVACQDLNGDTFCGGQGSAELREPFCIQGVITSAWFGGSWQEWAELRVFVDGPILGNPALSSCGPMFSPGVSGRVDHWPGGGGGPPPFTLTLPDVRVDPPGDTILPVSVTGASTVVLGCTGTVQVTAAGASLMLVGVSLSPSGCAVSPCAPYTSAGIPCTTNPFACCVTLFAVTPSGSSDVECVRESNLVVDLNRDGHIDYFIPIATVTGPPC